MNYKKLIAAIIALAVCAVTGSNLMAHGFGGGGAGAGGGGGLGGFRGGFNGGGFRGGFSDRGFRGGRFGRRGFDDFGFFGDFGDPFFYYQYPYYGYYSGGYYPYGYGYESYNEPVYQSRAVNTVGLVEQVQLRLARAGYYRAAIDGVNGNATRRAIREYETAHGLPVDGQIRGRLLTTMGVG